MIHHTHDEKQIPLRRGTAAHGTKRNDERIRNTPNVEHPADRLHGPNAGTAQPVNTSKSKAALVTGAAGSLGRAIARKLLADGFFVQLADVRSDALDQARTSLDPSGEVTDAVVLDLRDVEALQEMALPSATGGPPLEVLVNNAGMADARPLRDISVSEWDDVLAVNLRSAFFLTRRIAEEMAERGYGRVINMASLAGQSARPSGVHYAASKAGLIGLTRVLASEYAPHVTVNAVAPGPIDTPLLRGFGEAVVQQVSSTVPVGRLGTADEVAALVSFLASEDAGFITGATYDINGGILMR